YLSRSFSFLLFSLYGDLRDLHSFPTRRSSDLDGSNGVSRMLLWRSVMDPRIHLLIIDPQNDFCDVPADARPRVQDVAMAPALPVSGADQDMRRLADFVVRMGPRLRDITVTLDSHPYVAIERTTFWKTRAGQPVAPF